MSPLRAAAFARTLGLELTTSRVCLACLSFVAFPLDLGDGREAWRQLRSLAPGLWEDGLEAEAVRALRAARRRGDPRADEALRDIEISGPHAAIVHAIVWQLAEQMVEDIRRDAPQPVVAE